MSRVTVIVFFEMNCLLKVIRSDRKMRIMTICAKENNSYRQSFEISKHFFFVFNRTNRELTRWLDEIFHSQVIKNVPSTIGWLSNTQRRNWRVHGHDFCTYTTNQSKSQFLSSLTLLMRCILCVWIPYLLEIVETTLAPR